MPEDRTGILIARAWTEEKSLAPFRAYVRKTTDGANGLRDGAMLTDVDAVDELVRAGLKQVQRVAAPCRNRPYVRVSPARAWGDHPTAQRPSTRAP